MTKRIALKLLSYPVIPGHRALTAARRVLRYVGNDSRFTCLDCPIGGRDREDNGPKCRRTRSCDRQATAQTIALAVDNGQHPFGPWKCLMQRAMDGEHVVTFDGPFAALQGDE
jgi:hypothetical protein